MNKLTMVVIEQKHRRTTIR
uniref:Uncharacterized protein n=1 Tax=Arundo donax TaxID=35708 RepID=A0A0A8Z4V0_ARUDO